MPAPAEVDERSDRALVEQRRDGDHERARRQGPRRDHVHVLPRVAELDAGLEQRVDEPVLLHEAAPGLEPAQHAAEGDEPDAVAALEEAARERGGDPDRVLERALAATSRLGEAVEEDDDVGVALGMSLVDDEAATASGRAPVDRANEVTGHERTRVGELEALGP